MDKIKEKDVGYWEDTITVFINLCHAEFHSQKSYIETDDDDWLKIADELRRDRQKIQDEFTPKGEGELWCVNKHLALVIGGYLERASRDYEDGNVGRTKMNYAKAKKWLGVFLVKNKIEGGKK